MKLQSTCIPFALAWAFTAYAGAQSFSPPRLPNGRPNFSGVWRDATASAAFDVEAHAEAYGTPAGPSVIIDPKDGKLPYLPSAKAQLDWNKQHRELDPVGHCHPHGVPRTMVPPFPMEIVEDEHYLAILFETSHDMRIIPLDGKPHGKGPASWQGDSRGHWEGDTLVVDVVNQNGKSWLDQAGNFVDKNVHVVERYTMTSENAIRYEATITDPTVYSLPWTMRIELRRQPRGTEIIEYDCVEGERDEIHYPGAKK